MAKSLFKPPSAEVETTVTLMRKVAPERFEVVTGTIKGALANVKVLEANVSLVVGRGTARKAIEKQKSQALASLGLAGDN